MHDGCVRLLQKVLGDKRTAQAGQDWLVTQLATPPVHSTTNTVPTSDGLQLPQNGSSDDSSQITTALTGSERLHLEERSDAESTSEISRRASEVMAEIVSSPAMEHELQRVLRSTLRAPAVQEAAADAVGGVGRLTAAAAADAVGRSLLPWMWLGS